MYVADAGSISFFYLLHWFSKLAQAYADKIDTLE